MSVFTPVNSQQLVAFLSDYDVGGLIDYEGIAAGVENSNFYVDTDRGQYVLTVFERVSVDEIPYFLQLTAYLASKGLPCALPQIVRQGGYLSSIAGKPAALVQRLPGDSIETVTETQCHDIGHLLATLHEFSCHFPRYRANPYNDQWFTKTVAGIAQKADHATSQQIRHELDRVMALDSSVLPRGTVHTDVFRDNVLHEGSKITGVIDFYYACTDVLLLDIATVANDWCLVDGVYDEQRERALLQGYESVRKLTPDENAVWKRYLRKCAFRFWLSRLYDKTFPRTGGMVLIKDPDYFRNLITQHAGR